MCRSLLEFIAIVVVLMSSVLNVNLALTTPSESQLCRYRNLDRLPQPIYSYFTDWGCYDFTRNDLFVGGKLTVSACSVQHENVIYRVPGIVLESNQSNCVPFNHENIEIVQMVIASFQNVRIHMRWLSCCKDALRCCLDTLSKDIDRENVCPALWDGWSCISPAPAYATIEQVCSPYSYSNNPPRCHHFSSKECFSNSTWNDQTDYSTCSITPRLKVRSQWHIIFLSISIAIAGPAVLILICYHGPQLQKLQIIRNLLAALVVRNTLILITQIFIVLEELTSTNDTTMSRNEWPCKMLTVLEKLASNAVFTCMLFEGIFLHQLLTNVFANRGENGPKMMKFYIIGVGVTISCIIVWSILMALFSDEYCWVVTDTNNFRWINDAPRLVMLFSCCVLLAHIAYRLWKSFKNSQYEHSAASRTAKALMLCMPLFGIPLLAFIVHPDTDSCVGEQVYYFAYYIFESLQVVAIAVCHCYTDREVKKFLLNAYAHVHDRFQWKLSISSGPDKRSMWTDVGRRGTDTTMVDAKRDSISTARDHDGVTAVETLPSLLKLETVPECSENMTEEIVPKIAK